MVIDRIHDRVQKSGEGDPWEVKATTETKEEKKRDEEKGRRQREQDSFGETSDFIQLLSKDPRKYRREKIDTSQISDFTYRGISTHRENAILEVDISLIDGTLIQGAQVAISRQEGMKFISRKPGEPIVLDQLVKGGSFLTVALPQKVPPRSRSADSMTTPEVVLPVKTRLEWYYYLIFGILIFALIALVYIFVMV